MKSKQLAILGAIVVALIAVKLLVSLHERRLASDLSDAGVTPLLPASPKAADVRWVRVGGPGQGADAPSFRVTRPTGSDWVVTSAQNVRAEGPAVSAFVESAVGLSGEERGEGASHYAEFGVDEAHAIKVELGTTDPEKPAATLWLGKAGDSPSSQFVRVEGSERVSHVTDGLKASLGLYGDAARLDPDFWIKKELLTVDGQAIKSIAVERPDVYYAFARSAASAAKEWSVTAPAGFAWPVRKDALASTLGRVANVRIDGVASPDSCAGTAPKTKVIVTEAGGSHELAVGAKIPDKNDVTLQLAGDSHCYRLPEGSVSGVAPQASSIFDVPAAFKDAPSAAAVKKVTYTRDGATTRLAQPRDGDWTIESSGAGKADSSRVSRLVGAVTGLHIDDLAETSRIPPELLKPAASVTLQAGGKSLTVIVLGKRLGGIGEERYVRIQGGNPVPAGYTGVIGDHAAQSMLIAPGEFKAAS